MLTRGRRLSPRGRALGLAVLVVGAGLLLRLGPWRVPLAVHHYGGGVLWGMMLYLLVRAAAPRGWTLRACLAAAALAALLIELSRLIRTPDLDAFRATLAGQLLLGRIFSAWNLLAYAAGILAAAGLFGRSGACQLRRSRRRAPAA